MTGLTPEQRAFFDRAERVFGTSGFSEVIQDARGDLAKRNRRGEIIKGESRVIGFTREENDESPS